MRARDNARPMSESTPPGTHTHKITLLLAIAGLFVAGYGLWRSDATRDREDATRDRVAQLETGYTALHAEMTAALARATQAREDLQRQWQELAALPAQVRDLTASHEDLRARTERPQRAWSRAEALYLIELAQRRLNFDRDVPTAIAALEAADARLASLSDPSLNASRARIAQDLQALRSVPQPDIVGVMSRIAAIEAQLHNAPLKGVLAGELLEVEQPQADRSFLRRSWDSITGAFTRLFTVHRLDEAHGAVVSIEEQMLRRQHLSILSFAARQAAMRGDGMAYHNAINDMRNWLERYFVDSPAREAASMELSTLLQIDVAPTLPNVSGATTLLQRAPSARAAQ